MLLAACWARAGDPAVVLVFGDSLSAGYGIAATDAWPARLEKKLRAEGRDWRVVNASVSGETTAGGRTRLLAALASHQPRLLVLELGANDGLRGLPLAEAEANLAFMIEAAQRSGARVHLVGMRLPPNYGPDYTDGFAALFPRLAERYKTGLTPFLLAPIIERPELFLPDQLHPTAEGCELLAQQMWRDLAPLL